MTAAAAAAVHKTRKNANRPSGAAQQRSGGAAERRNEVYPKRYISFSFSFSFSMRSYNSH
jgi:hypothetical protein